MLCVDVVISVDALVLLFVCKVLCSRGEYVRGSAGMVL